MDTSDNKYIVQKLYMCNLSVESPVTGRMPAQVNQPSIDIDISGQINRIADHRYEVAVRIRVSARVNGTLLFLIELTQAGLFLITHQGEAHEETLLRHVFPQIIFPAARSNVANAIIVAGYQPIVLDHIMLENFFQHVPVTDKREVAPVDFPGVLPEPEVEEAVASEPADVPVPSPEPVAPAAIMETFAEPEPGPAPFWSGRRVVALAAVLGVTISAFVWRADLQQFAAVAFGKQPAVQIQMPSASSGPAVSQAAVVKAPPVAIAPNPAAGLPVAQWEEIGRSWLAAQSADDFTVELLRTADLEQLAGLVPASEGQPLFLVKLAGAGNSEYAVLSGVYKNEEQARQDAENLVGVHQVMRFGDYR